MFGEQYAVALDPLPAIEGASLTLALSYRGCSAGDAFSVEHRVRGAARDVWLRKQELENTCGAFFREVRTFVLPATIGDAAPLYLLSPNNNPYLLRP